MARSSNERPLGGAIAGKTLSSATLEAYFNYRWGEGAVAVTALDRFSRGVSRETWGVEIESGMAASAPPR